MEVVYLVGEASAHQNFSGSVVVMRCKYSKGAAIHRIETFI